MKRLACVCAFLPLFLAGPAEAGSYAWCQVNGAKYHAYLSGFVEIGDSADAFRSFASGSFGKGFKENVQSLDPAASTVDCNKQDSLFYAQDYVDVLISANPGFKFVKTGWREPVRTSDTHVRRGNSPRTSALNR